MQCGSRIEPRSRFIRYHQPKSSCCCVNFIIFLALCGREVFLVFRLFVGLLLWPLLLLLLWVAPQELHGDGYAPSLAPAQAAVASTASAAACAAAPHATVRALFQAQGLYYLVYGGSARCGGCARLLEKARQFQRFSGLSF